MGHHGLGAKRQRPARGVVPVGVHRRAVGHLAAGKHLGVERRLAHARLRRQVGRRLVGGRIDSQVARAGVDRAEGEDRGAGRSIERVHDGLESAIDTQPGPSGDARLLCRTTSRLPRPRAWHTRCRSLSRLMLGPRCGRADTMCITCARRRHAHCDRKRRHRSGAGRSGAYPGCPHARDPDGGHSPSARLRARRPAHRKRVPTSCAWRSRGWASAPTSRTTK